MKIIDVVFLTNKNPVQVWVKFEDGSSQILFNFYSDELSFTRIELLGLTKEEALALRNARDKEYLQS